jgi:hypothetical protein
MPVFVIPAALLARDLADAVVTALVVASTIIIPNKKTTK